jgi:hypothetical protein
MLARVEALLARPQAEREALAEDLFRDLAVFAAKALSRKHPNQAPDSR